METQKENQDHWLIRAKLASESVPLKTSEVLERIARGEINEVDWIFDSAKEDWVRLAQHPHWSPRFRKEFWSIPWVESRLRDADRPVWVFKISAQALMQGPVNSREFVHLLRSQKVPMNALIWAQPMDEWKPAFQLLPFPLIRSLGY